jgi:microcystin-dependent protein
MSGAAISTFGGNQPHNNMMPYLGMYWIIAMSGIFPTRA